MDEVIKHVFVEMHGRERIMMLATPRPNVRRDLGHTEIVIL